MTRLLVLFFALALVPSAAVASGFGGDGPPSRIPVPARVFRAVVEDMSGTRVEVTRVTWNGEVFLYGNVGDAQVTVPFEKIAEIRIEPTEKDGHKVAFARLTDGTTVRMIVEDDLLCYGATTYGNYQITVDHIRRIEVLGAVEEPVKP